MATGARYPPLDYLGALGAARANLSHPVPQNLTFCAHSKHYSVAMNDPQTFTKVRGPTTGVDAAT